MDADILTDEETEFMLILDVELDDTIPCNSGQCPSNLTNSHPATWYCILTICGHHVYGCDVAYRSWTYSTADGILKGKEKQWNCNECGGAKAGHRQILSIHPLKQ